MATYVFVLVGGLQTYEIEATTDAEGWIVAWSLGMEDAEMRTRRYGLPRPHIAAMQHAMAHHYMVFEVEDDDCGVVVSSA